MVQPIDYGIEVQDPTEAFLSAFKTGSAITQSRLAQEKAERDAEQQKAITAGFDKLRQPGATAADYANLAMVLPETQAKSVRESFALISQEQQQNAIAQSGKVFSALKAGKPDIAIGLMEQQIAAKRNSGDEEGAKFLETWRDVTREDPQATEDFFGFTISQMPGGDKVIESSVKLGEEQRTRQLQPFTLSEAKSKAEKAATEAKFGEAKAVADLNLTDAQIKNYAVQQDIAKQNQRIAAMQAQAAKEGNVLKQQELQLKIDTAREARDQSVRDKYSQAQNVLATFDNTLVSVDKILNNWGKTKDGKIDPNLSNSTVKSATGPVQSRIFTTSQDVADFEEQVGSLESQAFLSQVEKMRGLGALTEREGARLVNALASLSLRQSPKQLAENLLVVRDLMKKARSSAEDKYGSLQSEPATPAATPAAAGGLTPEEQAELNRLRQRFPGGR